MKQHFLSLLSLAFVAGWTSAQAVEAHAHAPGMLGVALHEITPQEVVNMGLPGEYGAWVEAVAPGSPAAEAGLEVNDVIVAFNSVRVESARALRRMVTETPAGRTVELRLIRRGQPQLVRVTLGAGVESVPGPAVRIPREPRSFGAWIEPVQPQLGEYLGLDEGVGLVVNEVQPDSPAARAGILARDILAEIDGKPVTSPEMVGETINAVPGNAINVILIRSGQRETVTVRF